MNSTLPIIRDVPPNELTACLQWLLGHVRVERAQWIVAQLTDRVKHKKIGDILAVEATRNGQLKSAAIAVLAAGHAANLLAISRPSNGGFDRVKNPAAITNAEVFGRLVNRLRAAQVTFVQTSADPDDDPKPLLDLGFERLATLAFLVLESAAFEKVTKSNANVDWRFEVVGDDEQLMRIACDVAERSFSGTQDCPGLSDYRSAAEIVDGYRMASSFDPSLWRLLIVGAEPAGCLFLTRHPVADADGATREAIELSYMGLVPQYRGRRLGEQILTAAVQVARQQNAIRMVLAVDQENSPANTLYRRLGWQEVARESVWAMRIMP